MIIPVYRVTTSQFPIAATTTVYPGQVVKITSTSGKITLCGSTETPIGLAGDRNVASEALEWVNRVSDSGNDTAASGMMTVYHSGGEFYTDQYAVSVASLTGANLGAPLYAVEGVLSTATTDSSIIVARLLAAPGQIMSGVPGVDVSGDIALGSEQTNNNYIAIKLAI